jgi:phospholipase C
MRSLQPWRPAAVVAAALAAASCSLFDPHPVASDPGPPCATDLDPAPMRAACAFGAGAAAAATLACPPTGAAIPIQHIIVLMQENRSFDHYLGHLPGNGQDDVDVAPDGTTNPGATSGDAPVPWFHATADCFDNPNHSWHGSHVAWDGGKNDGFVAASAGANDAEANSPTGRHAMGYYDASDVPFYYQLASTFAISDRYFSDAMGPTLTNRLYLYAGSSFGIVDGDLDTGLHDTIFSELSARGISWKVYKSDVPAADLTASFLIDGIGHLAGLDDFAADAQSGNLPQVAWIDPSFLGDAATLTDEEPPADMQIGQQFVYNQVRALMSSPSWATSAMFITYDEAGGLYDHVPPPAACPPDDLAPGSEPVPDSFTYLGFRVPLFVVSPFAKAHFVSHVVHSHTSILRFIEAQVGIPALTGRDANSDALFDLFDFQNPPFLTPPALAAPTVDAAGVSACQQLYGG